MPEKGEAVLGPDHHQSVVLTESELPRRVVVVEGRVQLCQSFTGRERAGQKRQHNCVAIFMVAEDGVSFLRSTNVEHTKCVIRVWRTIEGVDESP